MNGAVKIIGFGLAALAAAGAYTVVGERVEEKHVLRGFVEAVAAVKKTQDVKEAALQARFKQIDVDRFMQASGLASSADIVDGRAELARYRALLVERDALTESGMAQLHRVLDALPAGRFREQARRGSATAEARDHELQAALDRAQVANADAVQAVFDWADRNHAIVHARGTGLVVDGQAQLDELKALDARVSQTGQAVDESLRDATTLRAEATKKLGRLQDDLAR